MRAAAMPFLGISTVMYGWTEKYWRQEDNEPAWGDIFKACAESGMDAVELDPSPHLVQLASEHGLSVSGSYLGLPLHEKELQLRQHVVPFAEMLAEAGGRDLVINADQKGGFVSPLKKTEDEFKQQGENLSVIAEICKPYGLKASLHNHADDRHNAEGYLRSVIRYASADAGLCVDTGWALAAGIQPENWLASYPERIFSLHLRNQRGSVPAEDLLEGEIDIESFITTLHRIGYTGWLTLELWHREDTLPKRSLKEDTKLSAKFLERITAEMV